MFDKLREILGKASQQLRDVYKSTSKSQDASPKIKLSRLERMRWPFLQPSMEPLQSALRDAKGTLTLILQVVHLRHAHTTASIGREEQNDLIRMIAAMRRQQLASAYGGGGSYEGLGTDDSEDSDAKGSSEVRIVLEAWSVTPNTLSDEAFQPFLITPIPISQQQIAKALNNTPQEFREIASMIDSLSSPERDAILGRVLGNNRSQPDDSTIRSISSQSWTGSHDLFGKVISRKFRLIIERRDRISKSLRTNMKRKSPAAIHIQKHAKHDHDYSEDEMHEVHYHGSSESDETKEREDYILGSSPSPIPEVYRVHRRRRPAQVPPMPSFERRKPEDWERKRDVDEKRYKGHTRPHRANLEKKEMKHQFLGGSLDSQLRMEPQSASELSDGDLVKNLLAQYTNFDLGEPLVQGIASPPPAYEESFLISKRDPRPY